MDTVVVSTQEPVFTKTSVEEVHAGVVVDHSTMDVDKVKLSTVLDDSSIQGVVNGSGNKETEHEKEEVMKTICVVEDSKIVEEKESETGTNEQGTAFVHEPKNTEEAKIILADVTLEKEKEDDTTQKPEELSVEKPVTEEGETETKNSQEEEKDISKASEEIPIKTDEVQEEKDSTTVESSVHGTEDENSETVSVEEITRNGENIVKETAPDQESTTHDVETKERVLVEAEKDAEPRLDAKEKDETETVNTVVKDTEIGSNGETTVHDLEENADAVEAIKNSDDAEQVSREVTGDKEKEEDIIHKEEEVFVEITTIEGEVIEPKAEEHEQVLVRDIPQDEILVPEAENLNTSTGKESAILKTKSDETDAEPSLDLNEVQETVTPSDEVQETNKVVTEPPKPSPDQRSKYTEEDEHVLGRNMSQGEAESLVTKEDREQEDKEQEKTEKFEGPINLAFKVDREELMDEKKEACQVSMERGVALNESEAEGTLVIKHPDVESGEQMEKPSLESPSKVSVETRKTLDEKIKEEEEEVSPHQQGQEEGSYVPESIELKEKAKEERILDLAPLQEEESCLPIEKDESDEVVQVSSAISPEGETLFEANEEEEQVADKIQSILEIVDTEPVKSNEETTVHESISLRDDSDLLVEAIKNSDDADQEVTGDRGKEEDIIQKAQEVQESLTAVETPTIQGEDIELKASKDIEEHEHVLVRDIPQEETLVPKAETVNTSTGNESAEPSLVLKEKEETVTPSDEVQESITLMEPPKLSPEQISKNTEEDEHVLGSSMLQGDIIITEAESLVTKENKEAIMDLKEEEKTEKLEEVPSDLALEVDKEEVMDEKKEEDEVAGGQNMEKVLELKESEAELVDQNITDKTEEKFVEKPSLESPSEETSKRLDEKIQEKQEEEVTPHQEGQERSEVEEKSKEERSLDLTPLQESETVFEAQKIKEIKANEKEEQVEVDKIQSIVETVETVDTELVKSNEDDIAESLNSAGDEIQIKSKDRENVQIDETDEEKSTETSVNETENEHNATVSVQVISNNSETIVHETANEEIKNSDEAEEIENSQEVTGDREKEEDIITRKTTEEVRPSDQVDDDFQTEESVEVKSKENLQRKHENVLDVPSEKLKPETESQDQTEDIPSEILLKEELKDEKTEVDGSQVMGEHLETNEQEEEEGSSTYGLEIKEETLSVPQGKVEATALQQEQIEEYEATNDQQSHPVEDEGGIVVDAVKLEEEQAAEKIKNSIEPQSLLPSNSEEQERETVSEKIEDEKVEEEEPIIVQIEEDAIKSHVNEAEAKKEDKETQVGDTQQGETIVYEPEAVHSPISGQVTKEDTEPRLNLKEETETVILSDESQGREESVEVKYPSEKMSPSEESSGLKEEESCPPKEQKNEMKEEDSTSAHQTPPVEEKSDQVSSATLSEEREAEKIEDLKEPVEASRQDGRGSSKLDEEQKHKEILEVPSSETIPQETLSDVMAVQLKREDNEATTESHEEEAQTRDEQEKVISEEEAGETLTRELEEDKTVGLDASKTSENECTKQQEFENLEAPQLKESSQEEVSDDQSPSFITELEDQIPKQIKEIHEEEETKEPHKSGQDLPVETSHAHQPPSSATASMLSSTDDFTFSKSIGDENSSTLPVVGILKELHTTLEENERGTINADEPETLEKSLVVEETPASEITQANISREVEEQLQEESREIAECKEETPADLSLTQVLPGQKILITSKQEEDKKQEDVNASTSEKISLQEEEHPRDFEISKNEKLTTLRETDETFSAQEEDASELGVGHDSATTPQVGKEQETHNVLGNDQEIVTSEKQITEPLSVAEKELNEEHVMDFPSETSFEFKKVQQDKNQETVDALITGEKVQLQDQSNDFGQEKQSSDPKFVQEDLDDEIKDDGHDSVLALNKDSDLKEEKEVDYVKTDPKDAIKHGEKNMGEQIGQEATKEIYREEGKQTDTATAIQEEIKEEENETTEDSLNSMKNTDDEIKDRGLDSVVPQKKESGSMEEKKEVENNMSGKIGHEATKKIYEEECKQIDTATAIKEEKKETPESCLDSMKNIDDATEKTQDKPQKQEDEVSTQQKREIADETEQIVKEPSRNSLSDLIQKVEVTDKTEVATTEPRIEEEAKAEGEEEDGDEHKDDKTSPDSIVMVEAKDTVSIIKTHKKSQGILSGVGSKVKHSISKVKKALTGKSSHTTKPSSPQ